MIWTTYLMANGFMKWYIDSWLDASIIIHLGPPSAASAVLHSRSVLDQFLTYHHLKDAQGDNFEGASLPYQQQQKKLNFFR